jgi:murein L,D-transpeptidase YafK
MAFLRLLGGLAIILALASCSKFPTYNGPEVTRIEVHKGARKMYLLHGSAVLKAYDIQLGFTAAGPKQFEGDGKTPEGRYVIDRRNPNSAFYLSIGINYPKPEERAFAASQGKRAGGDIFIHGWGDKRRGRSADWTAGCISVKNREMREIYAMVRDGTVIDIRP